jgi:hypothetical protein
MCNAIQVEEILRRHVSIASYGLLLAPIIGMIHVQALPNAGKSLYPSSNSFSYAGVIPSIYNCFTDTNIV